MSTEKITPQHRERHAYIYIRQSSPKQVQHHKESQRNQYALRERAATLGWIPERIHVIDADLGQSGQHSDRVGFRELVSEVSLGHVGIVLAYEASRLARNNADWYGLLDLAAVMGTLIADTDGVYDPRSYNDRMLLGLRGMLSEAELHLLRLRLDAGRLRQVERGSYRQALPTGLVRLPDGRVVKDPDLAVQRAIALVFTRFATLGSAQRVVRSLCADQVLVPRHQRGGPDAGNLLWRRPTESAVYGILHNPAYAGAFVYGRSGPAHERGAGQTARRHRPLAEWPTIHRDMYPSYVSWEEFMGIQERLTDNAYRFAQRTRGAPREGRALLAGLALCGRCGRQMKVAYKPHVRYICPTLGAGHAGGACLTVDGPSLETAVVDAFCAALQPAELALLDEVLAAQRAEHDQLVQQHADQVARATYEARLAERQYRAVDPDNRLVAAEVERRWEMALRTLAEARDTQERVLQTPPVPPLDPALRAQLSDLSSHLPTLWASGRFSPDQKKELLRSLIRRIVLTRPAPQEIAVKIIWVSSAVSALTVHPPIHRATDISSYNRLVDRLLTLSSEGYQDAEIARRLTAEGFRAARADHIPSTFVKKVRRAHGQASLSDRFRREDKINESWTIPGLARALGVQRLWLYRRMEDGTLAVHRHPTTNRYLIPDEPDLLPRLQALLAANR